MSQDTESTNPFFDDTLYRAASKKKLLGREEEAELIRRAQAGDRKALDRLVRRNIRFVYHIARKFINRGLDFEDLVQEGLLGLLRAIDKFELERGLKLTTYAARWISAFCGRAASNHHLVKQATTQRKRKAISLMPEAEHFLTRALQRKPTAAELAEWLGISELDLSGIQGAKTDYRKFSLDRTASVSGSAGVNSSIVTYKDLITDDALSQETRADVAAATRRASELILEAMDALDFRERDIFERRFVNDPNETLAEIGKGYRLSRERIRQIERIAIKKMRGRLIELGLRKECADILELMSSVSDMPGYGDSVERSSLLLKPDG